MFRIVQKVHDVFETPKQSPVHQNRALCVSTGELNHTSAYALGSVNKSFGCGDAAMRSLRLKFFTAKDAKIYAKYAKKNVRLLPGEGIVSEIL